MIQIAFGDLIGIKAIKAMDKSKPWLKI